jgi:predicted nucleic acid-binding protein
MGIVIADASPLVGLSLINRLVWLPQLFGSVHVLPAVMQEVLTDRFTQSESNIRLAIQQGWLIPVEPLALNVDHFAPTHMMAWKQLDAGEAQSIAYAASMQDKPTLLMDERAGRRVCAELGLTTVGTAGVVLLAKENQLIEQVKPELLLLHNSGFWLSPIVMRAVLQRAGES